MGHFYDTLRGRGRNQEEAIANGIHEFLYENGHRYEVREILKPRLVERVLYQQEWIEVWEFELHTHA